MTVPRAELQTLTPGALWAGYKIDASAIGGSVYYVSPSVNEKGSGVVWQGITYTSMPIEISGLEATTQGSLPQPQLKVSNLNGLLGALIESLDDLTGAIITRVQTYVKNLDAANFVNGNAAANPGAEFDPDIWFVEQLAEETADSLTFTLSAACDVQGMQSPGRLILANICTFGFKNSDGLGLCPYTGSLTSCDHGLKTPNGCVTHFGTGVPLPFGGFPGAQQVSA